PLSEMCPTKLGWNKAWIADDVIRGYLGELQDFAEAIVQDREPFCGIDLAVQTMEVLYAAYQSAEEGRRVDL
ncbi:MAG: gfo/Idh/MocA family oxidoreductase, partial [Lawsonibacter sp.]|nr:gfo/Idh/MocA family oxidoreductase [Lawsonibacter sp.]